MKSNKIYAKDFFRDRPALIKLIAEKTWMKEQAVIKTINLKRKNEVTRYKIYTALIELWYLKVWEVSNPDFFSKK